MPARALGAGMGHTGGWRAYISTTAPNLSESAVVPPLADRSQRRGANCIRHESAVHTPLRRGHKSRTHRAVDSEEHRSWGTA